MCIPIYIIYKKCECVLELILYIFSYFSGDDKQEPNETNPQVDILPLPQLQKLLLTALPKTRVKILKIPFHATWRQSISDTATQ